MNTITTNGTVQGFQTVKNNIAEAVHRAVCEFTNSDGCGRCFHYALAGWALACVLFEREYTLQAGSLYIIADPPDGAVAFEPGQYGFERGEYHCWFSAPGKNGKMAEFVDLSSRHYKRLVERAVQAINVTEIEGGSLIAVVADRIEWKRKDNPPDFIWTNGTFPDVIMARPTAEATIYFNERANDSFAKYAPLVKLAWKHYYTLTGNGVVSPVRSSAKIGRNARCPCGSGRKFKHCCLNRIQSEVG